MKAFLSIYILFLFSILKVTAQTVGCNDPLANNYNGGVTENDGSCTYAESTVSTVASFNLASALVESSGLIQWNNKLWTINDTNDGHLYALDPLNGTILQSYLVNGNSGNDDWEEISQDDTYIYIGNFGNNKNGNRTDLMILRIDKNSILLNAPIVDTISFLYSNQINFVATGSNNTDFDCEAFFVSADSIYLFTKQWVTGNTSVYRLPKTPGSYSANLKTTFAIDGLVTGVTFLESKKLIVVCGYSKLLQPFIYLLYDFKGTDFFGGNKRKIMLSLPFHQIEGITTTDGLIYNLSNEYFSNPFITISQQLHRLDLTAYLNEVLNFAVLEQAVGETISLYPNPIIDIITIKSIVVPTNYCIKNFFGQIVKAGIVTAENSSFNCSELSEGIYFLTIEHRDKLSIKLIKK